LAGNETKRVEPKRKKFKMEKLEAKFLQTCVAGAR